MEGDVIMGKEYKWKARIVGNGNNWFYFASKKQAKEWVHLNTTKNKNWIGHRGIVKKRRL